MRQVQTEAASAGETARRNSARKSPPKLTAAKAAARERYTVIAELLKAEAGIRRHYRHKMLGGVAWSGEGRILAPEGVTRRQLYVLAHECGHIVLHSCAAGRQKPSHVKEHEAETYAHRAFLRYGLEVPAKSAQWARAYVGQWIMKDHAAGVPICQDAVAFATGKRSPHDPLPSVDGQPPRDFSASIDRFLAKAERIAEDQERGLQFNHTSFVELVETSANKLKRMPYNPDELPVGCGTCQFLDELKARLNDRSPGLEPSCKVHLMPHTEAWSNAARCHAGQDWRPRAAPPAPPAQPPAPPQQPPKAAASSAAPAAKLLPPPRPSFLSRLGDAVVDRVSGRYRVKFAELTAAPPRPSFWSRFGDALIERISGRHRLYGLPTARATADAEPKASASAGENGRPSA